MDKVLACSVSCQSCVNYTRRNAIDPNGARPKLLSRTPYQTDNVVFAKEVGCLFRIPIYTANESHHDYGAVRLARHELEQLFEYLYGTQGSILLSAADAAFRLPCFDAIVPSSPSLLR